MKKEIIELKISVLVISLLCLFLMIMIKDLKTQTKEIENKYSEVLKLLESKGE